MLQVILNIHFVFHPKFFSLGICPDTLPNNAREFFFYATSAARLVLAARWRQQIIPNDEDWLDKMRQLQTTVRLSKLLTPQPDFDSSTQVAWDAFQAFITTY